MTPLLLAALAGLVGGLAGAVIAAYFNIGRRGRDASVAQRLASLDAKIRTLAGRPSAEPPAPAPVAQGLGARPGDLRAQSSLVRPGERDPTARAAAVPRPAEPIRAAAPAPAPPPPPPPFRPPPEQAPPHASVANLNEITAAYGRVVAGQISRSAFTDFFRSIGAFEPVELVDGGQSLTEAASDESFLTSVAAGSAILVFPSYAFISNQTQFATIASVPESVAEIFELERGDGELIVERPAIYRESEAGPRLQSKGEIRGFGG